MDDEQISRFKEELRKVLGKYDAIDVKFEQIGDLLHATPIYEKGSQNEIIRFSCWGEDSEVEGENC